MQLGVGRRGWLGHLSYRGRAAFGPIVQVAALATVCATPAHAQPPEYKSPRTPWGHPDLQGVWDYRTATPLERPEGVEEMTVAAGEATESFLQIVHDNYAAMQDRALGADWSDFLELGLAEGGRTSLIVDPPNGRLPALTEHGTNSRAVHFAAFQAAHGPEDRVLPERCIMNKAAPIGWSGDNNNLQIFQTPEYVVVFHEMIHEVLVIPLDGHPHLPPSIRQWHGDPRGHWEGDTLVVETTNRHSKGYVIERFFPFPMPNLRVVERFTRTASGMLSYAATIEDSESFTRSWSVARRMRLTNQPIYEYACHEGNYSLPMTLSGARALETGEVDGQR